MRIYGTLKEIVAVWFKSSTGKNVKLTIPSNPSTDNVTYQLPDNTSPDILVTNNSTSTLTNKTFDADGTGNSITNIENADIKAAANIDRTKLASGSTNHVIINNGSGVLSSEAQLATSRGGTGVNSTATFPTSGTVTTDAGTTTLTNKTISGSSNTITNISLTSAVSGTLPIGNGGTGNTTNTTAFNALSPTTTKGDIIANDGTNNIRVGVGTNGQVLTADSTQTAGVKWGTSAVTPAAGSVYSDGSALQTTGAFTANGNKVVGINSGATATEYKSLNTGTSGSDFAIAHAVGSVTFNLPDASTSNRGVLTTGTQTLAGSKTWNDTQTFKASSGATTAGSYDTSGQWTFGPTGSSTNTQLLQGIAKVLTGGGSGANANNPVMLQAKGISVGASGNVSIQVGTGSYMALLGVCCSRAGNGNVGTTKFRLIYNPGNAVSTQVTIGTDTNASGGGHSYTISTSAGSQNITFTNNDGSNAMDLAYFLIAMGNQ